MSSPGPSIPGSPIQKRTVRFQGMFSPGMQEIMKEAEECSPVPPKKQDTRLQAQDAKAAGQALKAQAKAVRKAKAKSKSKAKSQAKAKGKAKAKAKSNSQSQGGMIDRAAIVYKVTIASKQSYIQVKDKISKKLKLWVAVGESMSPNHQAIIKEIKDSNPATKEQALEMRAAILAKWFLCHCWGYVVALFCILVYFPYNNTLVR